MSIEITDEMVRRFSAELQQSKWTNKWASEEAIRAAMDCALNPPPAPEIVVTAEMVARGSLVSNFRVSNVELETIYRAMRALEPKPDKVFMRKIALLGRPKGFYSSPEQRKGDRRKEGRQ